MIEMILVILSIVGVTYSTARYLRASEAHHFLRDTEYQDLNVRRWPWAFLFFVSTFTLFFILTWAWSK